MNLTFKITTGTITTDEGEVITDQAFAGNDSRPGVNPDHLQGRNNPEMCSVHKIGPLPCAATPDAEPCVYVFGAWGTVPGLGQNVSCLTQISGETYGRDGFFMHGESAEDPMNSSEGCVCVPHDPRVAIKNMVPDTLTVIA